MAAKIAEIMTNPKTRRAAEAFACCDALDIEHNVSTDVDLLPRNRPHVHGLLRTFRVSPLQAMTD